MEIVPCVPAYYFARVRCDAAMSSSRLPPLPPPPSEVAPDRALGLGRGLQRRGGRSRCGEKENASFYLNFWRKNLFQAEYPVYPGYGEEEDQHHQEEEEENQMSGERGSGLNVKDEVCRFPSFCSVYFLTKKTRN